MRTVKEILQEKGANVSTINSSKTVFEALQQMAAANIGAVIVTSDEDGALCGIFSERDYARKVTEHGSAPLDASVSLFMTEVVHTVQPESTVDDCMALVTDKRCRHLPVEQEGQLCGLVSIGDLVKASLAEKEFLIKQLTEYIQYP
ncbi:CBS domain-containing protein [Malonomonas rubra DSM 5091]|uniref:CBS domain-containing protein n=1 Tax=Malonomonas rubra DSM 5091 TaxID=1122189 RepID=A0A1M6IBL7_MALRU|nr:CBS domain-containing protein [Malonomonas rubra]SHJ31797.1 CBS domain-containing protein [Malonomonas rubra DSM 5091]